MDEMIIIHSDDSEVSRRLAHMLEETGYISCIIDDLEDAFDFYTTKPELIIIECQPDCLKDDTRIECIKKLSSVDSPKLLLLSTLEQITHIKTVIDDNHIKFLTKPILYTNFVREVDEILHSSKCT